MQRKLIFSLCLLGFSVTHAQSAVAECPYTAAELSRALGALVKGERPNTTAFAGGKMKICEYGEYPLSVRVERLVMDKPSAADIASYQTMFAGKNEKIPNDADNAVWQTGQGDLEGVTLHYYRGNIHTQFRVSLPAADIKTPAKVAEMRKKVLALRRLP